MTKNNAEPSIDWLAKFQVVRRLLLELQIFTSFTNCVDIRCFCFLTKYRSPTVKKILYFYKTDYNSNNFFCLDRKFQNFKFDDMFYQYFHILSFVNILGRKNYFKSKKSVDFHKKLKKLFTYFSEIDLKDSTSIFDI